LSLLELVVAVLVLSIAVLGTFRTLDFSGRQIGGEAVRLLARVVAANRAEELRLARIVGAGPLPARVQAGRYGFDVAVSLKPTAGGLSEATIRVSRAEADGTGGGAGRGTGTVLVTYLPPAAGP